jgi:hypothetical protein
MPCKVLLFVAIFIASALPTLAADKVTSPRPDGIGDPDATTCRPSQPLPASRLMGPEVCKTNSQWALLRKDGEDISADGTKVIVDPKGTNFAPLHCTVSGGGASSSGGAMSCH